MEKLSKFTLDEARELNKKTIDLYKEMDLTNILGDVNFIMEGEKILIVGISIEPANTMDSGLIVPESLKNKTSDSKAQYPDYPFQGVVILNNNNPQVLAKANVKKGDRVYLRNKILGDQVVIHNRKAFFWINIDDVLLYEHNFNKSLSNNS